MHKFVAKINVEHFRAQLENGVDLSQRLMLVKLLVEEENKLGLTHEQLPPQGCIARVRA